MADPNTLAELRREFQELYDRHMKTDREQFSAWFEEAQMVTLKNEEMRECAADIKKDQQRYWQLIDQLPKIEDFSTEELEHNTGRAAQLRDVAAKISGMKMQFKHKIDKLHFLSKNPSQ